MLLFSSFLLIWITARECRAGHARRPFGAVSVGSQRAATAAQSSGAAGSVRAGPSYAHGPAAPGPCPAGGPGTPVAAARAPGKGQPRTLKGARVPSWRFSCRQGQEAPAWCDDVGLDPRTSEDVRLRGVYRPTGARTISSWASGSTPPLPRSSLPASLPPAVCPGSKFMLQNLSGGLKPDPLGCRCVIGGAASPPRQCPIPHLVRNSEYRKTDFFFFLSLTFQRTLLGSPLTTCFPGLLSQSIMWVWNLPYS